MRPATIVGVGLLAAAAGTTLALTLGGAGVPPALASASPCAPATSPPATPGPRQPAARPAQAAAIHPVARAHAVPTTASAAPRPEHRATLYASGQHLRYSWRTSVVRWLGGMPASTTSDRQAAVHEGWWGEVEPPLAARVSAQR